MNRNEQAAEVKAAQQGDKAAFERLYGEYRDKLYFFVLKNIGSRETAEDIVSETFLAAMERIGELRSGEAFGAWLYSIAYKKCADQIKDNSRTVHFDSEQEHELSIADSGLNEPIQLPEDYAVNEQRREQLKSIIDSLKPDMKSAVILYYYDELSLKEVAKALGTTENAAKKRLFDARKKIKTKIEKLMKSGAFCAAPLGAILDSAIDVKYAGAVRSTAAVGGISAIKIAAVSAVSVVAVGVPVALYMLNEGWGGDHRPDSSSAVIIDNTNNGKKEDDSPDKLYATREKNSELIVVKIGDDFIDLSNGSWVHDLTLDDVADGQFVKVTADLTRQSGGIAGYRNEPFIDELKSAETMDTKEAITAANIPMLDNTTPDMLNNVCFYENGSALYLYIYNRGTLYLFKDGEIIKQYENVSLFKVPEVVATRITYYENGGSSIDIFDKHGRILTCNDEEICALDDTTLCDMLASGELDDKLNLIGQTDLTEVYDNYLKLEDLLESNEIGDLVYPDMMPDVESDSIYWCVNYCWTWNDMSTIIIHLNIRMTDIYFDNDTINDIYNWYSEALRTGLYDEEG